ncbi:MAG: 4Fe-4S dicluster domain-containing protein [Anaerolineae bacterium]
MIRIPNYESKLSRRDFLKVAAAVTAGLSIGRAYPVYASEAPTGQTWGVLIDVSRCTGCHSCALACKESNNLPQSSVAPGALDAVTYTFVDTRQVVTASGEIETRYVKRQCMHCLDAACVSACPAAAMHSSGEGPVIYRASRCLGCRYCQLACPFGVPRFNWENGVNPVINKCWMCYTRLGAGKMPACVEACPTGALRFGWRDELLAQAHAQIASNPGRYVNYVFGEFEVGGTSMLYLSDVPFEQLGFPTGLPQTAPPEETEKIMSKLPFVIGGVAAVMTGTAVYTHRSSAHPVGEGEPAASIRTLCPADDQEE